MLKILIVCALLLLVVGCGVGRPPGDWTPVLTVPMRFVITYNGFPDDVLEGQWRGMMRELKDIGLHPEIVDIVQDYSIPSTFAVNSDYYRLAIEAAKTYPTITVFFVKSLDASYPGKSKATALLGASGVSYAAIAAFKQYDDRTLAHEIGHILLRSQPPNYDHDNDPPWSNMATNLFRSGWTVDETTKMRAEVERRWPQAGGGAE